MNIKKCIGMMLVILGVILGVYVGGWIMLLQPISNVCRMIDAGTITASFVGVSVVKCIFAGPAGLLVFSFLYSIGTYLLNN